MAENKRRKIHEELEVVQEGFANGVAPGFPLKQSEKDKMIIQAEKDVWSIFRCFKM